MSRGRTAGWAAGHKRIDSSAATPTTASTTATDPALVGLWRRVNKCPELVGAVEEAGLGSVASSVVGDYFPDSDPEELAAKDDLCEGAEPFVHYHFFDAAGRFGSLDEEQERADDGRYEIIDEGRVRVENPDFDVVFGCEVDGDTLRLSPEVTEAMIEEARAKPFEFTAATWSLSVSYPGQEWKRVPCGSWC
jgi:hypothetical protein